MLITLIMLITNIQECLITCSLSGTMLARLAVSLLVIDINDSVILAGSHQKNPRNIFSFC